MSVSPSRFGVSFGAVLGGISLLLLLPTPPASAAVGGCETCEDTVHHSGDTNQDFEISLNELLRVIQFYNSGGYYCLQGTEDQYAPGTGGRTCAYHNSDYDPPDWTINLPELLRFIQLFNTLAYGLNPATEDGFQPNTTAPGATENLDEDFTDSLRLLRDVVPAGVFDGATADDIESKLKQAQEEVRADMPCDAAETLLSLFAMLQELRQQSPPMRATLNNVAGACDLMGAKAQSLLFNTILQRREMGNDCPGFESIGALPDLQVNDIDPTQILIGLLLPAVQFLPAVQADGSVFVGLTMPGSPREIAQPGAPGIPCVRSLVAVPLGAETSIEVTTEPGESMFLDVLPQQPETADQQLPGIYLEQFEGEPDPELFANKPFQLNENLYGTDRDWPPTLGTVQPMGPMRGMEIVQIEVPVGRWNPVSQQLTLFKSLNVKLTFKGGETQFAYDSLDNPFESAPDLYLGSILNGPIIDPLPKLPLDIINPLMGEELMILTHPDFREAADALAAWKREKGIMTNVYECGTGSGISGRETNFEIDTFIDNHYDVVSIKPSYILLIGDTEYIAHFTINRFLGPPEDWGESVGSDWYYAVRSYPGQEFPSLLPTFAVGRLPVDTLTQAQDIVNKIIDYEKTPPGSILSDPFYKRILIASDFQCCKTDSVQLGVDQRTYIEASEFVRPALTARGYEVDRIYTQTVDGGCASCDPPRPAYTSDPTPRRYSDGTLLPAAIGASSGFTWNGNGADISAAFNQGRFLAFHRDHGSSSGWANPSFQTSSLPLSNGPYQPVVFSINCTTGYYDNDPFGSIAFGEKFIRQPDGGAIAFIGASRVSPSTPNSMFSRGFFDAVWPEIVPDYGSNTSIRRVGDIMNHAKIYLATKFSSLGVSYSSMYDELILYNLFGDPTLEMWTSDPYVVALPPQFGYEQPVGGGFTVTYAIEGVTITAYELTPNGLFPIGRGKVSGGEARLNLVGTPTGEVFLAANLPDSIAATGSVQVNPQ